MALLLPPELLCTPEAVGFDSFTSFSLLRLSYEFIYSGHQNSHTCVRGLFFNLNLGKSGGSLWLVPLWVTSLLVFSQGDG